MDTLSRILCVEDDPDIRLVLRFSLGRVGGYELLMCPDGPSALAQAAAFAPQLVLLDVMMPGMSGPETLAALRAMPEMRGVPVVFLTAKALLDEVEDILALGATGLIVKPFDPMRLPRDMKIYWEHGRGPLAD